MRLYKAKKSGFTLVEMLIVIVIIGILASALIPRLMSARGRANDTARKADLQQVATAIISYQIDKGEFPDTAESLDALTGELYAWWLASIPSDPDGNNEVTGIDDVTGTEWEYMYTPITKNGFDRWGFVIMAKTETENGSNYVYDENELDIFWDTNYGDIQLCKEFVIVPWSEACVNIGGGECEYDPNEWCLRYIYKY